MFGYNARNSVNIYLSEDEVTRLAHSQELLGFFLDPEFNTSDRVSYREITPLKLRAETYQGRPAFVHLSEGELRAYIAGEFRLELELNGNIRFSDGFSQRKDLVFRRLKKDDVSLIGKCLEVLAKE